MRREERTRIVISPSEDGEEEAESYMETYEVSVPIRDVNTIYGNLLERFGLTVSEDDISNIREIYYRQKQGGLTSGGVPFVGMDGFVEPIAGWRSAVSSEFGDRISPITGEPEFHLGIDLSAGSGVPVYAVLDGVVTVSGFHYSYGNYIRIDHGGGFETLYAHNSQLLVGVGTAVTAGQAIAAIGSSGDSTGPHLHFETIVNGQHANPRAYLP